MHKTQAWIVFVSTIIISYIINEIFYNVVILPILGPIPLLGALLVIIVIIVGYKLVGLKYDFRKNSGGILK